MRYEGDWYLSHQTLMDLLGDRSSVVQQAFAILHQDLARWMLQPDQIEMESLFQTHQAVMELALQMDAMSQSSLSIDKGLVNMCTFVDGEEQIRKGSIVSVQQSEESIYLNIKDRRDGEINQFEYFLMEEEEYLRTFDQELELLFGRESVYLFNDQELDLIEQILGFSMNE